MKRLLYKLILAPVENMCIISLGTNSLCEKLHFCFSVLPSSVPYAQKQNLLLQTNYFMLNWKCWKPDCLGGSDPCSSQLKAWGRKVPLKSSAAAWSANLNLLQPQLTSDCNGDVHSWTAFPWLYVSLWNWSHSGMGSLAAQQSFLLVSLSTSRSSRIRC